MSNGVIKVPSIKENPVNVYEMDQGEEKAFPWLFPTGMVGFSHEREQKLSLTMYLKNRLYNYRGNFRKKHNIFAAFCSSSRFVTFEIGNSN